MSTSNALASIDKVTCVGAGKVGRSWAVAFAAGGCSVNLFDVSSQSLAMSIEAIAATAGSLQEFGLIEDADALVERVNTIKTLEDAVDGVGLIQESIAENLEIKCKVLNQLDATAAPNVIIASSTSALKPDDFMGVSRYPERCIVAHPLNPPHAIPVVELCPSSQTSDETVSAALQFYRSIGMSPITLKRPIDGFILNRLQAAVLAEAFYLIDENYCDPEDIEIAMTDGLARRWAFIGPLMTGHLNASKGYREYIQLLGSTFRRIADDLKPTHRWTDELFERVHADLSRLTPEDEILSSQLQRDRNLLALAKHLQGISLHPSSASNERTANSKNINSRLGEADV